MSKDYSAPSLLCDLIMKGGIASGVIYPLTVCALAERYSFVNIGGTSAGAIAAAAAAAAECGRRRQAGGGFDKFSMLPEWIGSDSRLLKMFKPDSATSPAFGLAMAFLSQKTALGRLSAAWRTAVLEYPVTSLLGAAPGLFVGVTAFRQPFGVQSAITLLCALILLLCGLVSALAARFWVLVTRAVPANFYGLSKAFSPSTAVGKDTEGPLTNWLTSYLNELSGLDPAGRPLTFGDLYSAPSPTAQSAVSTQVPGVNLEMMTTALNLGRPYRLPFRDPDQMFYFSPADFRQLFPETVIDHMLKNEPARKGFRPVTEDGEALIAFPAPEHLPVVVATRMSLSFPLLISAVPLYAVDYTLKRNEGSTSPVADRCWFSDGGECSNLPVHFFDSAVPRWPTFAIDLKGFHPDYPKEEDAVYLPKAGRAVQQEWVRFEQPGEFGSLAGFFGAILNAMQTWQDTRQSLLPGVRDRMIHISQRPSEGGLNIDMDRDTILRLSDRGRRAGEVLVQEFSQSGSPRWKEHRWARFLTALAGTDDWMKNFDLGFHNPVAPDSPLEHYLEGTSADGPATYPIAASERADFARAAKEITDLARASQSDEVLSKRSPKPKPELRLRARI